MTIGMLQPPLGLDCAVPPYHSLRFACRTATENESPGAHNSELPSRHELSVKAPTAPIPGNFTRRDGPSGSIDRITMHSAGTGRRPRRVRQSVGNNSASPRLFHLVPFFTACPFAATSFHKTVTVWRLMQTTRAGVISALPVVPVQKGFDLPNNGEIVRESEAPRPRRPNQHSTAGKISCITFGPSQGPHENRGPVVGTARWLSSRKPRIEITQKLKTAKERHHSH